MLKLKGRGFFLSPIAALLIVPQFEAQGPPDQPAIRSVVGLEYPRLANIARIQGSVELLAQVSPDGTVRNVKRISGNPLLAAAPQEALTNWRFAPCASAREL